MRKLMWLACLAFALSFVLTPALAFADPSDVEPPWEGAECEWIDVTDPASFPVINAGDNPDGVYFGFVPDVVGSYLFTVQELDTVDVAVSLYDSAGQLIRTSGDSDIVAADDGYQLNFRCPHLQEGETYYLFAHPQGEQSLYPCDLKRTFDSIQSVEPMGILLIGRTAQGEYDGGGVFQFAPAAVLDALRVTVAYDNGTTREYRFKPAEVDLAYDCSTCETDGYLDVVLSCDDIGYVSPQLRIPVDTMEHFHADDVALVLGEPAAVELDAAMPGRYYKFTPPETGTYRFYSSDNEGDPRLALFDAQGEQFAEADDEGGNGNFLLERELMGGETYYAYATMWEFGESSEARYAITVEPVKPIASATVQMKGDRCLRQHDEELWFSDDDIFAVLEGTVTFEDGTSTALIRSMIDEFRYDTTTWKSNQENPVVLLIAGEEYPVSVFVVSDVNTEFDLFGSCALAKTSYTYTAKAIKPTAKVIFHGKTLVAGTDYTMSYKNNVAAGTATATITGKGYCAGLSVKKTFTIAKAANPITVKAKTVSVKNTKTVTLLAKKSFTVSKSQGKLTTTKANKVGGAKITVAKNGRITVKKGLKKGTYNVKLKVTAAGNANYRAGSKTITVTLKVQ